MLDDHAIRHRIRVASDGLVDVDFRLGIALLHEENPRVSVEIGGVLGLFLHRLIAHLLGLLQLAPLHAEVVGVVVQAGDVVFLPLQAAVVGGHRLFLQTFGIQDVAHEIVEVGDDVDIALRRDLRDSAMEGVECGVVVVLLILGESQIVVEGHLVGIIERSVFADVDGLVPIHLREGHLQQLDARSGILGGNLQHLLQTCLHHRVGHVLERHVSHLHLGHVSIFRRRFQDAVEQVQYPSAVALPFFGSFIFLNRHPHHRGLTLSGGLGACHDALQGLLRQVFLPGDAVVVVHRRLHIRIVGLFLQGGREDLESLLLLVVLHQPVAHHHPIVQVAGMFVGKRLQRLPGSFLVAHQLIDAHLGQGNLLGTALYLFDAVDGGKHLPVLVVLLVESQQDAQHVGAVAIVVGQPLIDGRRTVELLHANVVLRQPFLVGLVLRTQFGGLLQAFHSHRVVVQLALVHGQIVPHLGSIGIDLRRTGEQLVRSVVVPRILLANGLQEDIVETKGILMTQGWNLDGRSIDNDLLAVFVGLGFLGFLGTIGQLFKIHKRSNRTAHAAN